VSRAGIAVSVRDGAAHAHAWSTRALRAAPGASRLGRGVLDAKGDVAVAPAEVRRRVASLAEATLGESPAASRRIAAQWLRSVHWSAGRWTAIATNPLEAVRAQVQAMNFPELERLAAYLRRRSGGIVLTTMHMGDYLCALLRLLAALSDRPLYISRRKAASDLEAAAFAKLAGFGVEHVVIRHGGQAGLRLLRAVRGGAIALLLYDLPARWGRTTPVPVLGRTMHWVIGPARLACLARARLVPLLAHRDGERDVCHVPRVYDAGPGADAAEVIAVELARHAGAAIRARPGQWQHWHLLPEMVPEMLTEQSDAPA